MPESAPATNHILVWLTLLLGALLPGLGAYARTQLQRARAGSRLGLALRAAAGLALAALFWVVFGPRQTPVPPQPGPETPARQIAVLRDASGSMSLRTGTSTRSALAEGVIQDLRTRLVPAPARTVPEVLSLAFAETVLPERLHRELRADRTLTFPALSEALRRVRAGAILLLSDGIFHDPDSPASILRLARTRGIPVYAVCCAQANERSRDLAVCPLSHDALDPERVIVDLRQTGFDGAEVVLRFAIDGQLAQEARVRLSGAQAQAAFALGTLPRGWHEAAVSVNAPPGDLCAGNNLKRSVFRIEGRGARSRILLLHGRPDAESRFLGHALATLFPDRVDVLAGTAPVPAEFAPDCYRLLVVADVHGLTLDAQVRQLFASDDVPVLVLGAGGNLEWLVAQGLRPFPVTATADPQFSPADLSLDLPSASLTAAPVLGRLARTAVSVHQLLPLSAAPNAEVALSVVAGRARHPLLVVDSLTRPRRALLATYATWRWRRSASPDERQGYTVFWKTLGDWLMSVPSEEQELVLTVREDPQDQAYALLTVLDRNQPQARLEDVSIRIDDETGSRTVNLRTPAPDGRGRRYRMPFGKPGEVLWCQASARGAPDPRYSVRTPVFRPDLSPEWLGLAPAPEVLAEALAEGVPARFAVAGDHARLLDELLRIPELPPCQVPPPRSHVLELALALLVAASLGAEWFVERRRLTGSD